MRAQTASEEVNGDHQCDHEGESKEDGDCGAGVPRRAEGCPCSVKVSLRTRGDIPIAGHRKAGAVLPMPGRMQCVNHLPEFHGLFRSKDACNFLVR
jgi:hypothetical protein